MSPSHSYVLMSEHTDTCKLQVQYKQCALIEEVSTHTRVELIWSCGRNTSWYGLILCMIGGTDSPQDGITVTWEGLTLPKMGRADPPYRWEGLVLPKMGGADPPSRTGALLAMHISKKC